MELINSLNRPDRIGEMVRNEWAKVKENSMSSCEQVRKTDMEHSPVARAVNFGRARNTY